MEINDVSSWSFILSEYIDKRIRANVFKRGLFKRGLLWILMTN